MTTDLTIPPPPAPEPAYEPLPLHPIWRQAAQESLAVFRYGEVIPMAWLYDHLAIATPAGAISGAAWQKLQFEILTKVDNFRDELLRQHHRLLVNIRGVGYRIVEPRHQTQAALTTLGRELQRATARAMEGLVNINTVALTLEEARANSDARANVAGFRVLHCRDLLKTRAKAPAMTHQP